MARIFSPEKVWKWKAEAQRRKRLAWSIADDWSDNRIVQLVNSHEALRVKVEYLIERLAEQGADDE